MPTTAVRALRRPDGGDGTLDVGILSPGGRERYDHSGGADGLEPIDGLPADIAGGDGDAGIVLRGSWRHVGGHLHPRPRVDRECCRARETGPRAPWRVHGAGRHPRNRPKRRRGRERTLQAPDRRRHPRRYVPPGTAAHRALRSATRGGTRPARGTSRAPARCPRRSRSTSRAPAAAPAGTSTWSRSSRGSRPSTAFGHAAFEQAHWPTHVLVGDVYVSVQFRDFPDPEGPMTTDLARRVVANLGT